jgi:hypothetical protein
MESESALARTISGKVRRTRVRIGSICKKHPELGGERYLDGHCVGCENDRKRVAWKNRDAKREKVLDELDLARHFKCVGDDEEHLALLRAHAAETGRESY